MIYSKIKKQNWKPEKITKHILTKNKKILYIMFFTRYKSIKTANSLVETVVSVLKKAYYLDAKNKWTGDKFYIAKYSI